MLDPRISIKGLLIDCHGDEDAINDVRRARASLEVYFHERYASTTAATSFCNTQLFESPSKDPLARYKIEALADSSPQDEITEYFALDTRAALRSELSPLQWWAQHEAQFPQLARLARDIFSIPGKSILLSTFILTCTHNAPNRFRRGCRAYIFRWS